MRIGQSGSQEELEVIIVGDGALSNLDGPVLTLFDLLLKKDGLECWIDILSDILKKYPLTELNGQL